MSVTHRERKPLDVLRSQYDSLVLPAAARNRIESRVFEDRRAPSRRLSFRLGGAFAALALIGFALGYVVSSETQEPLPALDDPAPARSYTAIIARIDGRASVVAPSSKRRQTARKRMPLDAGGGLETERSSHAELVIGPHRARISQRTDLTLEKLDKNLVELKLAHGAVTLDVAPLYENEKLVVRSGPLSVHVVGTVFKVERHDECAEVAVEEGRVRAEYLDESVYVAAGQSRRFCDERHREAQAAPARVAETEDARADKEEPSRPRPDFAAKPLISQRLRRVSSDSKPARAPRDAAVPDDTPPGTATADELDADRDTGIGDQVLSREERAFKAALEKLGRRERRDAAEALRAYLESYPGGTFAPDALFHLIRLEYRFGRYRRIPALVQKYERHRTGGARAVEVDIIHAQALLELEESPSKAYDLLDRVARTEKSVPRAYREQVIYLYVLAAFRTGRDEVGRLWARKYLDAYPRGRYVERAKRLSSQ